jgi:prolyl-tRNA synthetase
VPSSPNLVAGANDAGYHLLNTNTPRDYAATIIADLAAASDGDACIDCGQPLYTSRGVEVGNIFKLGTRYSAAIGATYLAADGTQKPIVMGSYGIGSGRLLACVAEEHHDDKGLIWPITVAPYQVHLVALGETEAADRVYEALLKAGLEVLYDDRGESPGVKFADADLIGIPIRLTVSTKSLKSGGVEMKRRDRKESEIVSEADLIARVQAEIKLLLEEIQARVVDVPFK